MVGWTNVQPKSASVYNTNLAAFWLALDGLAIELATAATIGGSFFLFRNFARSFGGVMVGVTMYSMGSMVHYEPTWVGWMAGIWTIFAVFIVTLEILGFLWLNSTNARNISRGSTLLITGGVIAFAMMRGFGVGSLFIFAAGVLGLTAAEIGK